MNRWFEWQLAAFRSSEWLRKILLCIWWQFRSWYLDWLGNLSPLKASVDTGLRNFEAQRCELRAASNLLTKSRVGAESNYLINSKHLVVFHNKKRPALSQWAFTHRWWWEPFEFESLIKNTSSMFEHAKRKIRIECQQKDSFAAKVKISSIIFTFFCCIVC